MNARRLPTIMLLLVSMAALVLSGLTVTAPAGTVNTTAATPAVVQMESGEVIEDEVMLVARRRRHPRVQAGRLTYPGWFDMVLVQLKPPLKHKAYKVVLQVRRNGTWVHKTVARSFNARHEGKRVEYARLWSEPMLRVGNRRLRVVVPAQHGFQRTVVPVRNINACSWFN